MIYIAAIAGVRPQFIKIAAFQEAVHKYNSQNDEKIKLICINAGQHYDSDLSEKLIEEVGVNFHHHLQHNDREPIHILANMIVGLYKILEKLKPQLDWVVIFGDANPTLAGAIAASRLNLPIVHVEAGMKRDDYEHEEINRQIADRLATVNLCVSKEAVLMLQNEGIVNNVHWTGDLAYDFMMGYAKSLPNGVGGYTNYILSSIHRPQNLDDRTLLNLLEIFELQSRSIIFLTHPRTKKRLLELGCSLSNNIILLDPLDYKSTISAIKGCQFILTDSGGIIREAYHFGKHALILRNAGAWSELVDIGFNKRVTSEKKSLINGFVWIENQFLYQESSQSNNILVKERANQFVFDLLIKLTRQ